MRVFWTVVLALALCLPLTADEIERVVRYDLDGDGVPETIGLRAYDGRYYESDIVLKQLVVFDQEGREIWSGPKGEWGDPLVFGGPYDSLGLHAIGEVEGQITLLGDHQRSDVRPTVFRLFHWDSRAFVPAREGALIPRGDQFVWVPANASVMCESWVGEIISVKPDGVWRVGVVSIPEQASKVLDIAESSLVVPEYLLSASMERELTDGDLDGLSAEELKFALAEIYARHGKSFEDPSLRSHFISQPWYQPLSGYYEGTLSDLERENAGKILRYQKANQLF